MSWIYIDIQIYRYELEPIVIGSMCGMHTHKVNTNQFKRWIDLRSMKYLKDDIDLNQHLKDEAKCDVST